MNAFPEAVSIKLAKLLPMLASDKSGEVVATAAAIGRLLKAEGLDWHDLAERLAADPTPVQYRQPAYPHPKPQTPSTRQKREFSPWPSFKKLTPGQRIAWLRAVERSAYSPEKGTRADLAALRNKLTTRPDESVTSAEIRLFNRVVKVCWTLGGAGVTGLVFGAGRSSALALLTLNGAEVVLLTK